MLDNFCTSDLLATGMPFKFIVDIFYSILTILIIHALMYSQKKYFKYLNLLIALPFTCTCAAAMCSLLNLNHTSTALTGFHMLALKFNKYFENFS